VAKLKPAFQEGVGADIQGGILVWGTDNVNGISIISNKEDIFFYLFERRKRKIVCPAEAADFITIFICQINKLLRCFHRLGGGDNDLLGEEVESGFPVSDQTHIVE